MKTVDIVITSFNGCKLLEKQLPIVLKYSPKINNIIVVDDAGTDDTISFLSKNYPDVKSIKNDKNLGFTKSTNIGVDAAPSEYVVLLNNDVYPDKDYIENSLKYFDKNPKLFAVTFNEHNSSWPQVTWQDGKLHFVEGEDKKKKHFSAWPSGGSCIVKKDIWRKLGGFSPIYSPGYWEDIDLGWRAWKQGYEVLWVPDAKVEHKHESTFKKLNPNYVSLVKQRNELLFTWQNITDRSLSLSHYQFLFSYAIKHLGYFKVILAAMRFYPQVAVNRIKNRQQAKHTDKDVLLAINKHVQ